MKKTGSESHPPPKAARQRPASTYTWKQLGFVGWGIVLAIIMLLGNMSVALFVSIFAIVLWIGMIADLKQAWRASLIPFSTIRGASQGPVKLKGHLDGETLRSPFTNTPCKAWQVKILYGPKTARISPKLAASVDSEHQFLTLNDGTGLCILPFINWEFQRLANWELEKKASGRLDNMSEINALPESGRKLIAEEMSKRPGLRQVETRWIFQEYRIDEGDTVYAQGVFKSVRGDQTPYDDGNLQRIERKGAAASWFSRWTLRHVADDLRSDQNLQRDAWRRYARKMLGLDGIKGQSALPSDQTINTLTSKVVDIVDGEASQYSFPFFATNANPLKARFKDKINRLVGFAIAIGLTGLAIYLYDPTLLERFFQGKQ